MDGRTFGYGATKSRSYCDVDAGETLKQPEIGSFFDHIGKYVGYLERNLTSFPTKGDHTIMVQH